MHIEHCTIVIEGSGRVPFHLRVACEQGVTVHIDLDGAAPLEQARRIALAKGYDVTHWMHAGGEYVMEIE